MTVWIYVDTNKEVGDVDHLKVTPLGDGNRPWCGALVSGSRINLQIQHSA